MGKNLLESLISSPVPLQCTCYTLVVLKFFTDPKMIPLPGLLLQYLLPFICKTNSYNDGGNFINQKLILLTSIELINSSHLAREEPYFTEFNTNFF